MAGEGSETRPTLRVRRARREDIAALKSRVGGPGAGRVRALRRLIKTLTADAYVIDRDGAVDGVVVVVYRRSFSQGGLVATIDALEAMRFGADEIREDIELLVECAVRRATRRGCVGIDTGVAGEIVRDVLVARGFAVGTAQLGRTLRKEEK